MRKLSQWINRQVFWRLPGQKTAWDEIFRGRADVDILRHERPQIDGKDLDDWVLQTIAMCPAGGRVVVERQQAVILLEVIHPKFIEQGKSNYIEIRVDSAGSPYLYFDYILFDTKPYPGFGAVAFYRAAQAAQAAGFCRIELLAAGGDGYKSGGWVRSFNGYHSWARYGFNADLWLQTKRMLEAHPVLSGCKDVLDVIELDPEWWRQNGDGCEMHFDLRRGSRSWHTLITYLTERRLK